MAARGRPARDVWSIAATPEQVGGGAVRARRGGRFAGGREHRGGQGGGRARDGRLLSCSRALPPAMASG